MMDSDVCVEPTAALQTLTSDAGDIHGFHVCTSFNEEDAYMDILLDETI